ncbi:hypothetical protein GGP57_000242 [Salinibacter ruber]|uniref:DUF6588 family protein n=1 Tax=Salinibacter ruber TaxID=146919 RepID=UPI002168EF69|nr:DUF6588 family protein [Salinibacter ruber]MCS3632951.1 hypothetical protein [Salinibacter ruber]MCS3713274.1 hypothetical protein [Salinibacter ruber]
MHTLQARLFPFLIALAVLVVPPSQAQNRDTDELGGALSSIGQQYADNYTQPITDALGANLNAGLFRTAEVGGEGIVPVIDVYVGVVGMGAFTSRSTFQPENETIEITTDQGIVEGKIQYHNEVPTIFGNETAPPDAVIEYDDKSGLENEPVSLPPGLVNTSIAPLAIPQIGAGTVLGTDAQVRFLPETSISDYGSVSLFGLSVRHSLSQYIPLSPVDLAVQGTWQSLSLSGSDDSINSGEIVDASGWALNAQVSKSVPVAPITFYGGLQYEQFGVDVGYTFQTSAGTSTVSFEQDASNNVRALAGVSVTLAVIQLNVDYALASNNTVSAGVGITL